jgi:alpha-D-xyloside xylohydrolase
VRARLLLALVVVACGKSEADAPPPRAKVSLVSGDYTLRVDLDAREVAVLSKDVVLARLPADGLSLGARDAVDDNTNYDPWPLFKPTGLSPAPEDLVWLTPSRFDLVSASNASIEVDVTYEGARARLKLDVGKPGAFRAQLLPTAPKAAYVRVRTRSDDKEAFYGLGESFDDVNQRGHVRAMQIELDGELESNYNEAHVPIPLVIGTRGWGLFVEDFHPGAFGVANEEPDRIDAIFGTGMDTAKGLTFHLFAAKHPLDITKHYYDLTGYPLLPARWALGPWIWRDENKDQAEVEGDLNKIRDLDLANTGLWVDRPYASAVNTFDFNAPQFPDPKKMITLAHDLGMRMALWHTPYLDEKDPKTDALRAEAKSKGYYPLQAGLPLNKWGTPIDLTNKAAFDFWQTNIKKYTVDLEIEGFKLDYGEDVVPGLSKARNIWRFSDGSDERTMHAKFTHFYHRAYAELMPKDGGFLLCRHGTIGDQKYTSVIWPGDLDADFSKHRETVTGMDGKKYVSVGGLPASIVGGLSLGPSGYPFYGADTGGYRHSPPNKELLTRWFEQTALSSVMQVGNSANTVPWEYDAELLDNYRTYARLHLRLFPYEWTYAQQIATTGRPIQRALGLAYPELGVHPNDEYMFGDELLVAPVVAAGKVDREVTFPPGNWIDWWTGKTYSNKATVPAPLATLPLFLREGGTVPMLRPTIDAMAKTTLPDRVDSYGTTPGVLWVRIAPAAKSMFTVFDGAKIEHAKEGTKITMSFTDGTELKSGVVFEMFATKPTAASVPEVTDLDAATEGYRWESGILRVKFKSGAANVTL